MAATGRNAPATSSVGRVLLLLRKDVLRRWRSPLGVLAMIAFPLVFSGMMGLAFSGGDSAPLRARLLVEDGDGNIVGSLMKSFLSADQVSDFLKVVEVDAGAGAAMIENGEAAALLRIPPGTTERLLNGEVVTLVLIRNPAQTILPEVAEQVVAILADVASVASRVLHQQTRAVGTDADGLLGIDAISDEDYARLALLMRDAVNKGGGFVTAPPITFRRVTLGGDGEAENGGDGDGGDGGSPPAAFIMLFVLPGISVYSLFIIGDQMMRDVLTETRLGTLRRQLSAPVTGGQIVAGKVLLTAVVAGVVLLILATFAGILAPQPVNLPAFALLSLALVLAVTGFAALIYGLARTESQGGTLAALVYLTLAFSGGSFLPLDNMPAAVRTVAPLSPFYWGTRGFQDLLFKSGGLAEVATAVAVLGGLGVVLLVAGSMLLQRKVLRGEAA